MDTFKGFLPNLANIINVRTEDTMKRIEAHYIEHTLKTLLKNKINDFIEYKLATYDDDDENEEETDEEIQKFSESFKEKVSGLQSKLGKTIKDTKMNEDQEEDIEDLIDFMDDIEDIKKDFHDDLSEYQENMKKLKEDRNDNKFFSDVEAGKMADGIVATLIGIVAVILAVACIVFAHLKNSCKAVNIV